MNRRVDLDLPTAVVANLLVGALLVAAAVTFDSANALYQALSQEDGPVEWATVWAFLGAAAFSLLAARRQRRSTGEVPWFLVGVALFCFVIAMEEISWGQRLLGYRPPAYFLEHNFQQELNLHNLTSSGLRKQGLKAIILGYGVLLPALAWIPVVGRWLSTLAVVAPPIGLAPAFVATFATYQIYPWTLVGEWVELMLGLAMLFGALAAWRAADERSTAAPSALRRLGPTLAAFVGVVGLGALVAAWSNRARPGSADLIAAAKVEIEALRHDFTSGEVKIGCGIHKRVYTFREEYKQEYLDQGFFAQLAKRGLPAERAMFFLDPWDSPYWVRSRCSESRGRRLMIYSFGPDRARESDTHTIRGDDVGFVVNR